MGKRLTRSWKPRQSGAPFCGSFDNSVVGVDDCPHKVLVTQRLYHEMRRPALSAAVIVVVTGGNSSAE
jgi:hypothetical protein